MRVSNKAWAVLGLMTNALVWGVSWWPLRQLEGAGLHPLWATGLTFAVVLVAVALYQPSVWRELFAAQGLWVLALASGFTNIAFNWAVTVGDVVRVVLLFYLMPAWALLFARWLLNERITAQGLLRLSLAVMGVLFVLKNPASPWPMPNSLPDWLALGGGATFALTNTLILKLHKTTTNMGRLFAMFAGGTLTALTVATLATLTHVATPLPSFSWGLVLAVTAVGSLFLIGNLAMQYGASRLQSSTTSLVMLTEIIFASLSAVWLGAAVLEARVLVGALFILGAALWAAMV